MNHIMASHDPKYFKFKYLLFTVIHQSLFVVLVKLFVRKEFVKYKKYTMFI